MSELLFDGVQEGTDGEWGTGAFPATPPAWPTPPSHTPPLRATTPPAWPTPPSHTPPLRAPTPQQLASPELSAQHALPPPTPFHLSHELPPLPLSDEGARSSSPHEGARSSSPHEDALETASAPRKRAREPTDVAPLNDDDDEVETEFVSNVAPLLWSIGRVEDGVLDIERQIALPQIYGHIEKEVDRCLRMYAGWMSPPSYAEEIVSTMRSVPRPATMTCIAIADVILLFLIGSFREAVLCAHDQGRLTLKNYWEHHFFSHADRSLAKMRRLMLRAPIEEDPPLEPTKESITTLKGIKGGGAKGPQNAYNRAVVAANEHADMVIHAYISTMRKDARKTANADRKLRQAWDKFQKFLP